MAVLYVSSVIFVRTFKRQYVKQFLGKLKINKLQSLNSYLTSCFLQQTKD